MSEPIEQPDPNLDDLNEDELAEYDGIAADVAGVLTQWYEERCCCRHHMVGTFLDLLAAAGYRVTAINAPTFEEILPEVGRG